MKCSHDKRYTLIPVCVTFCCNHCHETVHGVGFDSLTNFELYQVIKECKYYLKQNQKGTI